MVTTLQLVCRSYLKEWRTIRRRREAESVQAPSAAPRPGEHADHPMRDGSRVAGFRGVGLVKTKGLVRYQASVGYSESGAVRRSRAMGPIRDSAIEAADDALAICEDMLERSVDFADWFYLRGRANPLSRQSWIARRRRLKGDP